MKKQMEEKASKFRSKMNRQEFLLNKPILKEINQKKKDGTVISQHELQSQQEQGFD